MRINRAYKPLLYSKKRYNVLKGGAGSGKSYSVVQIEIVKASLRPERILWLRKVASTLRNSLFELIQQVLIKEGFRKGIDYTANKTDMSYTFSNGSVFVMIGTDDVEKLKSIAGITRIVMEEATEFEESDFDQIDMRLRGIDLVNPQITLMFNPISVNHWLCKRFDTNFNPDTTLFLNTTYRDNAYLDEGYKKKLEDLININENLYRIYVLNEWGVEDPDKLFAKDYKKSKHFGKSFDELYSRDHEIYLAWDFNIQNTCLAIQNVDGAINVLREYHIKGYDLQMLSELIKKDFPGHIYIINGDASGRAGSALTAGNVSAYHMLRGYLNIGSYSFHVPNSNPSHLNSRLLCNLVFKFSEVNICKDCIQLDNDLMSCEIDDRGSLDPYKKKHADRSHWLDPLRYHLNFEHYSKIKMIGIKEFKEEE